MQMIVIWKRALSKAIKKIFRGLRPVIIGVKTRLDIPVRFHSPGRAVLEKTILPYFAAQPELAKVLFVGCDWYTQHYRHMFKNGEFWTIDPDPEKRRYGAKNHIVGGLENLPQYCEPGFFDLIICNGVLGFGLNQKEAAEQAFANCFDRLRGGGCFMLGRDEVETLVPFSVDHLNSLKRFVPHEFPPLNAWRYSMKPEFNYVFCFFQKPVDPGMRSLDFSQT